MDIERRREYNRVYRSSHRQQLNDYQRKYVAAHREKNKEYQRAYYQRRPESHEQCDKRRIAEYRKIVAEAKNRPCLDCGLSFPTCVMDFDHVRGIKEFGIGRYSKISKVRLLTEIAKCDVVCANCHRIRTNIDRPRKSRREHR